MKLIHFTDTHFVPPGQTLYGRDPRVAFERCIEDINRHHADAELSVLTGDLTHWGEFEAFESLRECLDKLKSPLQLLVGNHDDRDVFRRSFPEQAVDQNGFVQSVREYPAGAFFFLDTNEMGEHAGVYCQDRLTWLSARLDACIEKDIYLFMHHPPFDIGIPTLDRISLKQKGEFEEVVRPHAARIKHLFFGHIHRPLCGSWCGIPISSLRAMNHQVRLDFDATGGIPGCFEPPAYAVVLFHPDRLIVHTHDFMDSSPTFDMANPPVQDWAVRYRKA
jgi:Icc protein